MNSTRVQDKRNITCMFRGGGGGGEKYQRAIYLTTCFVDFELEGYFQGHKQVNQRGKNN